MLKLTEIAKGFKSPTYVMQAPGDATRLYVLEQQGTVRVVKDGMLAAEPLIDLRDLTGAPVNNMQIIPGSYGEGGLLGATFDPHFADTKRLWLSYTKGGPAFSILQFTLDNPDKLDVTKFKELLNLPQYGFTPGGDATNHVGSMLAFGPDGCMYISRGDGLVGRYVWADWTERKIKTLVYKGDDGSGPQICDEYDTSITVPLKVRSFGEGVDGELYVVAGGAPTGGLSSAGLEEDGTLFRLDAM